jgi:hypothetical protein
MHNEKFMYEVGMIQKECVLPAETEVHDVTVVRGELLQIGQWTAAKRERFPDAKK